MTWRMGTNHLAHMERDTMPIYPGSAARIMAAGHAASFCGRDIDKWPMLRAEPSPLISCVTCLRRWYRENGRTTRTRKSDRRRLKL